MDEARIIARSIANSPLVKTAWAGCDPNWGRILSSIGNSGIAIDPAAISVFIGPYQVCSGGQAIAFDKKAAHQYMTEREYDIRVQLGRGKALTDVSELRSYDRLRSHQRGLFDVDAGGHC